MTVTDPEWSTLYASAARVWLLAKEALLQVRSDIGLL